MSLASVPGTEQLTSAQRAERLQAEALALSLDAFTAAYADLVRASQAMAACAELTSLPPGLREVSRQTVDWLDGQFLTIDGVRARVRY